MLPFLPGDTRGRAKRPISEENDLREKAVQQQMMNQRLVVGMNFSAECLVMLGIVQIKNINEPKCCATYYMNVFNYCQIIYN